VKNDAGPANTGSRRAARDPYYNTENGFVLRDNN